MTKLREQYAQLLEILETVDMLCQPFKVYREEKGRRLYRDNPEFNPKDVFSLSGSWQKIQSTIPSDSNVAFYRGAQGRTITYQQCLDLTEILSSFEKSRSQRYSPYSVLQIADRAVRALAPIDRYYGSLSSSFEAGETGALKIAADNFPTLADRPELGVDEKTLYTLSKAYLDVTQLLEKIHNSMRHDISPLLQEPRFGTRSIMDPPELKT